MLRSLSPVLAENALFKSIGQIFHPIFLLFGWVLAGIYSVIPNYAVAIAGLTILIMLALTPVTIKSTKSMIAMQRLQPEMKKLQAKYKGPENREQLNVEMMKLYKDNGTSPFGACLPSLLQMPFLVILYSLIRGLSFGKLNKAGQVIKATPRYIPVHSKMYASLVASKGQMHSIFGMDLSSDPFSHHGSDQGLLIIPYLALIAIAVFLQYFQMKQMNSRNPQAAAANPQMQSMQKFFPILFGVIYLRVPAGAAIYMVVSSAMRIGTQEFMFRTGMVTAPAQEREIGGSPKAKPASGGAAPKAKPKPNPVTDGSALAKELDAGSTEGADGTPRTNGKTGSTNGKTPSNGTAPAKRPAAAKNAAKRTAQPEPEPVAKEHPRSRSKRTRKAR